MAQSVREAIKKAFVELLEEHPISKITVKDIVGRCGVNRNTFYYHFRDIPALTEEIIMDDADVIIKRYPTISSIEEGFDAVIEFAMAHRQAVLHIYNSADRALIERKLWQICEYVVTSYLKDAVTDSGIREEDKEIIVNYYESLCFGQAIHWMENEMTDDIRAPFRRLCMLRRGMPEEMLRRAKDEAAFQKSE